jgi:hypothetical protein
MDAILLALDVNRENLKLTIKTQLSFSKNSIKNCFPVFKSVTEYSGVKYPTQSGI